MRLSARMTSKGQLTVPKHVREMLDLKPGDEVVFDIDERGISFDRLPNFIDLAGSVPTPPELRGLSWEEIEERAARSWVKGYR